jgi:hypothetical protein
VLYALMTRDGPAPTDLDRLDAGLASEPVEEDPDPLLDMDDEQLHARAAALIAGRL